MKIPHVHTGIESFSYIGPKLWNSLPEDVKKSNTLESFKSKLKELTITECPCSMCRTYIKGVGYFDHITQTITSQLISVIPLQNQFILYSSLILCKYCFCFYTGFEFLALILKYLTTGWQNILYFLGVREKMLCFLCNLNRKAYSMLAYNRPLIPSITMTQLIHN